MTTGGRRGRCDRRRDGWLRPRRHPAASCFPAAGSSCLSASVFRPRQGIECHPWPPPGRHDLGSGGSVAAKRTNKGNGKEPLGFKQKLWAAADKMRGHMDPAEYKHVALGLIFLKYISDAFEEKHSALLAEAERHMLVLG